MHVPHLKHAGGHALGGSRPPVVTAPLLSADLAKSDPKTLVSFRCNICGRANTARVANLTRETPSCEGCGSNVRFRAIVDLLINAVFDNDLRLDEIPVRKDIVGLGLSDTGCYAPRLAEKFDYTNTFFDCEPRLDIASPLASMAGRYDFLIASDVFEHVVPPVSKAFVNARRLLKPGGLLVFTVPFSLQPATVEHFPDLYDYRFSEEGGRWTLYNRTRDGRYQTFTDLIFHGGPGSTLEMRVFSRASLEHDFAKAGFKTIRVAEEPCFAHGIIWPEPWSVPILART
jgi:SAM-dependent methyltransferase